MGDEVMAQYRKRPVVIEATQWFKNGDHPADYANDVPGFLDGEAVTYPAATAKACNWEGQVVRYYRTPDVPGDRLCSICSRQYFDHGWIETLEGGHIVCPADWIITGVQGERYPCKPDIFVQTYVGIEPTAPHEGSNEAFYDDVIAPALLSLMKQCNERGMPFVATVEYGPGDFGTSADLPAERSLPMDWAYVAARSQGNADIMISHLIKGAEKRGHGSVYLAKLGVPMEPAR
jgi:hypothetical protein